MGKVWSSKRRDKTAPSHRREGESSSNQKMDECAPLHSHSVMIVSRTGWRSTKTNVKERRSNTDFKTVTTSKRKNWATQDIADVDGMSLVISWGTKMRSLICKIFSFLLKKMILISVKLLCPIKCILYSAFRVGENDFAHLYKNQISIMKTIVRKTFRNLQRSKISNVIICFFNEFLWNLVTYRKGCRER